MAAGLAQDTELAWLHELDLSNLLEDLIGLGSVRGKAIYACTQFATKRCLAAGFSWMRSYAPRQAKSARSERDRGLTQAPSRQQPALQGRSKVR